MYVRIIKIKMRINKHHILQGMKDSLPIIFGYAPLGIALGIMANAASFAWHNMFSMSVIVFAGSAQFIGVNMIASGAAMGAIIVTTFFVNFRHFLMSTAYSPYFKDVSTYKLLIMSFGITDESFAVGINKFKHSKEYATPEYILALNTTAYLCWIAFTVIGIFLGSAIPDYEKLGLGFALNAMFIGLIALMIEDKKSVIVCIVSGVLSVVLLLTGIDSWNVIIAAVISCIAIVGLGRINATK